MPRSLPKSSIWFLQRTRTPCTNTNNRGFASRSGRAHLAAFSIANRRVSLAYWDEPLSSQSLLSCSLLQRAKLPEHRVKRSPTRSFTQSTQPCASARGREMRMMRSPSATKKSDMKKMGEEKIMDVDLGLLPDTFVLPTGANRPSLWKEPKALWRIYKKWGVQRFKDVSAHILWTVMTHGTFSLFKGKARRRPSQIVSAALSLHKDMSMAFSLGDDAILRDMCEQTVLRVFQARISRRPADERLEWSLLAHVGRPRMVSFKTAQTMLEVHGKEMVMQQAVVQIRSRQSLRQGKLGGGEGADKMGEDEFEQSFGEVARGIEWQREREKEVLEYVVLMRRLIDGQPLDWKVWGFAKEAKVADLEGSNKSERAKIDLGDRPTKGASYQPSV